VRDVVGQYHGIAKSEIQTHLVEPGSRLLPELGRDLANYARQELEARAVEVHTDTKLITAEDDFVELQGQARLPTRILIWAGGVKTSRTSRSWTATAAIVEESW
jgi:NADH dehydrogenase